MIDHDPSWMICLMFKLEGSVLPKCGLWAASNALLAIALHFAWRFGTDHDDVSSLLSEGVPSAWAGYSSILGFILVFRNNQAYARFWEGATLVNQMRGEWYNATSSLIAFTSRKEEKAKEVEEWMHLVVRLMSILHCAALLDVCEIGDSSLQILDTVGLEPDTLEYLDSSYDRVEICVHWLQRLVVDAARTGILDVAPPILSRSFQELSRGVVNLNNAKKIKNIPFPFPYTQMLISMLIVHFFTTAFLASLLIPTWYMAGLVCFFVTGGLWSIVYIAKEVEQPFGEDPNDLPMIELQEGFNLSLMSLLDPQTLTVPGFRFSGKSISVTNWSARNTAMIRQTQRRTMALQAEGEEGAFNSHVPKDVSAASDSAPVMKMWSIFGSEGEKPENKSKLETGERLEPRIPRNLPADTEKLQIGECLDPRTPRQRSDAEEEEERDSGIRPKSTPLQATRDEHDHSRNAGIHPGSLAVVTSTSREAHGSPSEASRTAALQPSGCHDGTGSTHARSWQSVVV